MKRHHGLIVAAFGLFAFSVAHAAPIVVDAAAGRANVPSAFAIGDTLDLTLPDGAAMSLAVVASPPPGIAGRSFIANDTATGTSAIIKPDGRGVRITVDDFIGKKLYRFRIAADGALTFSVHEKSIEPDECATCAADGVTPDEPLESPTEEVPAAKSLKKSVALRSTRFEFPLAEHKSVIDILVAFDRGAKVWALANGYDSITDFADYAITKMNMVLKRSQLDDSFFYRFVGVTEIDDTYDVINNTLLEKLRTRSGSLSKLRLMREKCGADTITLLIDRDRAVSTTSGLGYEYLSNKWTFASFDASGYTCNICDIKTVHERYTMSHETGHNMGCGHSNRQGSNSGPGCNPYSCGYHFQDSAGTKRYTIMAYDHTSPESGTYDPVPYFSSPDIIPEELGVAVGTPTNNNRQTLLNNYKGVAAWREHVVPYEWDVRFLDADGNDIPDGSFFTGTLYVTLTNANPDATIYYTKDGTIPNANSPSFANGYGLWLLDTTTITACAVTNGVAMSFRSITVNEGVVWSGEVDQDGNGRWVADSSVYAWNNATKPFNYGSYPSVCFGGLAGISSATVTVHDVVAPYSASFTADDTSYVFTKGSDGAAIHLRDASFAPQGDLTFNVPVEIDTVAFTNPANHTLAFNAPFGQTVTEASGYCTNMIGIGANGTLVVSPGAGKTQYFDSLNTDWYFSSARFRVGEGTVVFRGPAASGKGVFGNTGIVVGKDGNLVLDFSGDIAGVYSSIACEGTITFTAVATANSKSWWTESGWRGTVALTNISTKTLALDQYGGSNSTVRLIGVSGYPGNCANTNITFDTTIELVDGADGALAWTVSDGYSTACTTISRLCGDGTLKTVKSNVKQGFAVCDASCFSGSLDIAGAQFTFGSTVRKNNTSQNGTIYVDVGVSVTNMATWSAPNLVVYGELANMGTLNISNSLTFDNGASFVVDVLPTDGVVLTSGSITTNGAFSVSVLGDENPYVAEIVDGGAKKSLVVKRAPLPETVHASITVLNGDWVDAPFECDLPTGWITNYYPSLDSRGAVAAKYNETAANGATVWQCYMLGLDPTNADSRVSLSMRVEGGKLQFAVDGLGETHALDGIKVYWYMKTSTNLVTDARFSSTREASSGLSPTFAQHDMPDKPTGRATEKPVDTLFYKVTATFVAED